MVQNIGVANVHQILICTLLDGWILNVYGLLMVRSYSNDDWWVLVAVFQYFFLGNLKFHKVLYQEWCHFWC